MLHKSSTLIYRWNNQNNWAERVRAYDNHTDREWLNTLFNERVATARQQLEAARRLRQRVEEHISTAKADDLSLSQIATTLATATKMEQDALDSGRGIVSDEHVEDSRPTVVVITGADDLT